MPRVLLVLSQSFLTQASPSSAQPQGLLIPHPEGTSKQVEYFILRPLGEGPWPTLIFLHGHQEDPRTGGGVFVQWGVLDEIAGRGFLAVAVSQPGYGRSTGQADFCGPFTQRAVMAVVAKLRAEEYASPEKLVILGTTRGALVAGLIAATDSSVSGVVLISGLFDLFVVDHLFRLTRFLMTVDSRPCSHARSAAGGGSRRTQRMTIAATRMAGIEA